MNATAITSGLLGFFMLCCLYAAQYWAYKSCKELRKLNDKIDRLIESRRQ
jgi:hypothetical protein